MIKRKNNLSNYTLFLICRNNAKTLKRSLPVILSECDSKNIIAFDTESRDGTAQLLRERGIRIIDIAASEFGHGKSRNLSLAYSDSEIFIFLNGDAIPIEGWLINLLKALKKNDAAFSRQIPNEGCDPLRITDLINHPYFRHNKEILLSRDSGLPPLFDTVSCGIKREVLDKNRFPDVSFGEDYLFAKNLIKNGGRIVYVPESVVVHSHSIYRDLQSLIRRHFEEGRLKSDDRSNFGVEYVLRFLPSALILDLITIASINISNYQKILWFIKEPFLRGLQLISFYAGLNEEKIPDIIKRRLLWIRQAKPGS